MKKNKTIMEERFYYCESCGNLAFLALASGVTPYCCGIEMKKLVANTTDANSEKHVPVVEYIDKNTIKVKVGSLAHPMTETHGIRFVCLETDKGGVIRYLSNDEPPETCFRFLGKPIAVYAFCNLHGLWRAEVPSSCEKPSCCYL